MYRNYKLNELRIENVGEEVVLSGWVSKVRDLGHFTFIDLRDRYGITQILVNEEVSGKELFEEARKLAGMTLDDVIDLLDETHKKILIEISKNPEQFRDPKTADALVKVASVVEKVTARSEKKKEQAKKEVEEERGVFIVDNL